MQSQNRKISARSGPADLPNRIAFERGVAESANVFGMHERQIAARREEVVRRQIALAPHSPQFADDEKIGVSRQFARLRAGRRDNIDRRPTVTQIGIIDGRSRQTADASPALDSAGKPTHRKIPAFGIPYQAAHIVSALHAPARPHLAQNAAIADKPDNRADSVSASYARVVQSQIDNLFKPNDGSE